MVDVDGVIVVHPHLDGWKARLEEDLGLSPKHLQEAFFVPHFDDVVNGRAKLHERLAPVLEEIAPHLSSQALADYWFAQDSHLDQDLLDQLAALRSRGVELHLATVQEHERATYLWQTMELRKRFDAIHYAAELGSAKPAPEFFAKIESRTGFAPSDMFFIDDKTANVEAARERGWRAAVWTGKRCLAELMGEAGITDFLEPQDKP
jgi:putative hydrolase of the HAD superfamily